MLPCIFDFLPKRRLSTHLVRLLSQLTRDPHSQREVSLRLSTCKLPSIHVIKHPQHPGNSADHASHILPVSGPRVLSTATANNTGNVISNQDSSMLAFEYFRFERLQTPTISSIHVLRNPTEPGKLCRTPNKHFLRDVCLASVQLLISRPS